MKGIYRFLLVSAAAVVMAVYINTFVHTGGLLPGGFLAFPFWYRTFSKHIST